MDNVTKYTNNSQTYNNSCNEIADNNNAPNVVIFSLFAVLSFVAVVLNIALIAKLSCRRKQKKFTRFFLTSMATVDLFVGLTVMPFNIANEFTNVKQLFGSTSCSLMNSADVMFSSASIIHLSILTFERYVAMCRPFSYLSICSRRNMILLSLICWIVVTTISFGFIMPGLHQFGLDDHFLRCTVDHSDRCIFIANAFYSILSSSLLFYIPGFFILYFNTKLLKHVRRQSMKRKHVLNSASPSSRKRGSNSQTMRITRTIAILTGCFFVCWLPFFIVCQVVLFIDYGLPYMVHIVVLWLGYGNSAMNPLLYLILESKISCIGRS